MVLAKEVPGSPTNGVANSSFTTNATSWDTTGTSATLITTPAIARATASWTGHSTGYGRVTGAAAAGTGTRQLVARTAEMAVTGGGTYFTEITIKPVLWPTDATISTGFRVEVQYFSSSGATTVLATATSGTLLDFNASGEVTARLTSVAPLTAKFARIRVVLNANGFASGNLEFLIDDAKFYGQSALDWSATNVGDLANATDRKFSFKLNQPQTVSFTLPITDPLAAEIISAVGNATGMPIIKLYRDTTLKMVAEVLTTELVSASPNNAIRVVAVETMWNRLTKRLLPDSKTRLGYTIKTPTERSAAISEQLNDLNGDTPSGIEPGSTIGYSTLTSFTNQPATGTITTTEAVDGTSNASNTITGGPWSYKPFLEWVQELAFTLNGFDFWQDPLDPVINAGVSGLLNIADTRGAAKPEAIFEYGTGKANVTEYSYSLSGDTLLNTAHGLPPAWPSGVAVVARDWNALAAFRQREEVVSSDLVSQSLRQQLMNEHVSVRKQYRRVFTFVPQIEDGTRTPRFSVDYDIGDYVEGRVRDEGLLLLQGAVRVYGADVEVSNEGQIKTTLTLVQEV